MQLSHPHRLRAITSGLLLTVVSTGFSCFVIVAQTSTQPTQDTAQASQNSPLAPRRVVRGRGNMADPIRITAVYYDDKLIQNTIDGIPFDAPDDWLSHISVRISNMSSKPLIAGDFQLTFDDSHGNTLQRHNIRFGMLPEHMLYLPSGVKFPQPNGEIPISPVAPGERITIPFNNDYAVISAVLLKRGPLSDVKICTIDYGAFYFTDGLRWSIGNYDREDPSTPGHYVSSPREALMPTP